MQELKEFNNKEGHFAKSHIWIIAEQESTIAHKWHAKYSAPFTKVLGKFACRVTSKIMGIGEAEHQWKATKRQLGNGRGRLGSEKCKKQAAISAAYCPERSTNRHRESSTAGKLWEDADFKTIGLGVYCEGKLKGREREVSYSCVLSVV